MAKRQAATKAQADTKAKDTWLTGFVKFLELGKPLGMMICAGIAGVAVYLFTPLQAKVNQWLFPADATVKIYSQQQELFEEDSYIIDVQISSNKWNPVPSGTLEITYPQDILDVEHGARTNLDTPQIEGTTTVTPDSGTRFYAHTAGSGEIVATLTIPSTKSVFVGSRNFEVKRSEQRQYPTLRNYSGNWSLELGNRQAEVKLKESGRTLSGTYRFKNSPREGFITGQRDSTYSLTLIDPAKPFARYRLEGESPGSDAHGIELKGIGKFQVFTEMSEDDIAAARPTSQEDVEFHMVAASK